MLGGLVSFGIAAEEHSREILQSIVNAVEWPFAEVLRPGEWFSRVDGADGKAGPADGNVQVLDLFWTGVGRRLIGVPDVDLNSFHLDEFFGKIQTIHQQQQEKAEQAPQKKADEQSDRSDRRDDLEADDAMSLILDSLDEYAGKTTEALTGAWKRWMHTWRPDKQQAGLAAEMRRARHALPPKVAPIALLSSELNTPLPVPPESDTSES